MSEPLALTPLPLVTVYDAQAGVPLQYSDLVTCVVAPNPGPFTFLGTNTYLIGRQQLAVVDPGPDDDVHLAALIDAIASRPVSHVLVTHTHRDHSPLATKLARLCNAELVGCGPHPEPRFQMKFSGAESDTAGEKGESGDRDFRADRQLHHGDLVHGDRVHGDRVNGDRVHGDRLPGDRLHGDGWTIETVHTPGHLSNHLCFALEEDNVLFTGDHIMGWSTSVISPTEGDLGDYLDSCQLLLTRSDSAYLSAHGAPVTEPRKLVEAFVAHRQARSQQILTVLSEREGSLVDLDEFVPAMYPGLDERLIKAAKATVLAHLIHLTSIGFVETVGTLGDGARFRRTDWC
jgi:glyoxylase-like metal-dependent hydrolase (beta-lactamase superfamily II)